MENKRKDVVSRAVLACSSAIQPGRGNRVAATRVAAQKDYGEMVVAVCTRLGFMRPPNPI